MNILGRIVNALSLLRSEPHLIALVMIVVVLGVMVLAVLARGTLDPLVFGIIFFVLAIILAIVGVVALGYISLKPNRGKHRTDIHMEEVANRYPAG